MEKKIGAAIIGGTGFGAGELLRLLHFHPAAEVCSVVSGSKAGSAVTEAHPHLRGCCDLNFESEINFAKLRDYSEQIIFLALPHGESGRVAVELSSNPLTAKAKIIDLSGDFRLQDKALHSAYYPESPVAPELRAQFIYGLPELGIDSIKNAALVANPGCLATASLLAALPLMEFELEGALAIDAKTGSSGAGRALKESTHHPLRHANFFAYKPLAHQHEPEIEQTLASVCNNKMTTSFVVQSLPLVRGIYVTLHATLKTKIDSNDLAAHFESFYQSAPFVRITPAPPQMKDVIGTNFCDIAVSTRENQVVVMSAIDNLVKGMAGQAIQNMNLLCGLDEATGLMQPGLGLV